MKFNPLILNGFDLTGSSTGGYEGWKAPVATEASLPVGGSVDGDVRVTSDSDFIWVFDGTTSRWINSGIKSASVGSSPNASGYSLTYLDVASNRRELQLTLQPADATNPGIISSVNQTIPGSKTFPAVLLSDGGIDVTATGGTDTLAIGSTNADVINIGRSGITINLIGSTINQTVTNLNVTDKNITVNSGGAIGSGATSGIQVEEAATITGFLEVSSTRNSWRVKAPNRSGEIRLAPNDDGFINEVASLTLTADRLYTLPDLSGIFGLVPSSGVVKSNGSILSSSNVDLTTEVTGILPLANGGSNASLTASAGAVTYSTSTALALSAVGSSGQVLQSNGTSAPSWLTLSGTAPINYSGGTISVTTSDVTTTTSGVTIGNGTNKVVSSGGVQVDIATASGSQNGLLSSTDWTTFNNKQPAGNYITALTGDVTASGPGSVAATIALNAVTDAKFRQSSGLSLVGRASNSTGGVADITAANDNEVLRRSGTSIGFGLLVDANVDASAAIARSKLAPGTADQIVVNNGSGVLSSIGLSDGQLLIGSTGAAPVAATITAGTGISVTNGAGSITVSSTTTTATDIPETSYSNSTDVVTDQAITGFAFAAGTVRAFTSLVSVSIDATTDLFAQYTIEGIQRGADFQITTTSVGDVQPITFSITSAGQVRYSKTTTAGHVDTLIKFRAMTVSV